MPNPPVLAAAFRTLDALTWLLLPEGGQARARRNAQRGVHEAVARSRDRDEAAALVARAVPAPRAAPQRARRPAAGSRAAN